MKEKRKALRIKPLASEPIEVQIIGVEFMDVLYARDISTLGIGIWVPHQFKGCNIDEEVQIIVTLPELEPFLCQGLICHKSSRDAKEFFGVRFTRISKLHHLWIKTYVQRRLSEETNQS
jgi:c-di-GMP-binding flagellar brake protein YcgR